MASEDLTLASRTRDSRELSAGATTVGGDPREEHDRILGLSRGDAIGRYLVLERLGAGGMGVVYAAWDPELDRKVAIKLLLDRGEGAKGRALTVAEAQAMARLDHPNVVTVHDVGEWENRVFIAMQYLEGESLGEYCKRQNSAEMILNAFIAAGRGLWAAHQVGLIHRDFKPDNVRVSASGEVRVLDFGLARLERGPDGENREDGPTGVHRPVGSSSGALAERTVAAMAGTPAYMSPEQHSGSPADPRSDQFSFCVALYEALYERHPFPHDSLLDLAMAVLDGAAEPPPGRRGIRREVRKALMRGLSRSPRERWPDMAELLRVLDPPPAPAWRSWALTGGVLLLAGGGVAWAQGADARKADARRQACAMAAEGSLDFMLQAGVGSGRAEVEAPFESAFVAAAGPGGQGAAQATMRNLERWRERWESDREGACLSEGPERERRLACLEGQRVEAATLVGLFDAPTRDLVARAAVATANLGALADPGACSAQRLRERAASSTANAEVGHQVERLQGEARALRLGGRYEEAEVKGAQAIELARTSEDPALLGPAAYLQAQLHLELEAADEAEPLLYEVIDAAEKSGDRPMRARALSALVNAASGHDRFEEALRFARLAKAAAQGLDQSWRYRSGINRAVGVVKLRQGKLREAKGVLEDELARLAEEGVEDANWLAHIQNNLGLVERDLGELEASKKLFKTVVETWSEVYGPEHPNAGHARMNLGTVFDALEEYDRAIEEYEKAFVCFDQGLGTDSLDAGYTAEALAITLGNLERYEEALGQHEKAQEIFRTEGQHARPDLAMSLDNMGLVYRLMGDAERALELHRDALALWEEALGPEHPDLSYPLVNIANDLMALDRKEEAKAPAKRAAEIRDRVEMGPEAEAEIGELFERIGLKR